MNTYYQIGLNSSYAAASAAASLPSVMRVSTVDTRGCGGTHYLRFDADWASNRVIVDDGEERYPLTESQREYLEYLARAYEGEFITPEGAVFTAKLC